MPRTVSIITGGGSGIGAAIAKRLVSRSQPVIIVGRRMNKLLETKEASENPSLVRTVAVDISDPNGHQEILRSIHQNERVKSLIHNAALLEPVNKLMDSDPVEWRKHMEVNIDAPLFLTKALLPKLEPKDMDEHRGGRILHISSGAAHYPYRGWGAYCTSKAAFHMVYKVLAAELSPMGISVGSMRPGVVDTPMQDLIRDKDDSEFPEVQRFKRLKEQGNLMDPQEVAVFVDWLLNETDDVEFSEKEWDVRDEDQRYRWQYYI
eukprot:40355_1